ncbi:MAG: CoA-binding protein [Gammaproteobacteria bacterium]|nr:CoA-binding protein [Gammaproteobacteria bacterium]
MDNKHHNVVILGASNKPDRYAYRALTKLRNQQYSIIPVHPKLDEIEGIKVKASLSEITEPVNTLTLYIGPGRSESIIDEIIELKPDRIIFNPGTESKKVEQKLKQAKIPYILDCTLIMLDCNQF